MAGQHQLTLSKGGISIDLYSWLNTKRLGKKGTQALSGIVGFGFPDQSNRWFEGAGDGASWRGARQGRRSIDLPIMVEGDNRNEVMQGLSDLARVLDPKTGPARLHFALPDGELWFVDVVRDGGGDWSRNTKDSDNRTFVKFILTLVAGDPYWTRERAENFFVRQDDSGRGLMPRPARLELSDAGAFGINEVTNIGDAEAFPLIYANGAFTRIVMTGPNGEVLDWSGNVNAQERLTFDAKTGTVKDQDGDNRYDGFSSDPPPLFWSIAPGTSEVTIQAFDTDNSTEIVATWQPRRWMVM
jgi:hypothetical protein